MSTYTNDAVRAVGARADAVTALALDIWAHPELSLEERRSAKAIADYLESEGFSVTMGAAGMDTAFIARKGSGKPVIGFLGEYDALPGMSQSLKCEPDPVEPGAPGHACGHNLLGAAIAGSAAAAAEVLEKHGLPGTVIYYGCPAEEIMYGKIKMDEEHLFDECDACLCWHPFGINCAANYSYSAMTSIKFRFFGKASHAAESPELGRSALDAVELMNTGANYLREHMIPAARIHYSITNGGGKPNVVPAFAESWYYVRAPYKHQVDELVERLKKIQHGAALMTETEFEFEEISGCYNTVLNKKMNELLYGSLTSVPLPEWSAEDLELAEKLRATVTQKTVESELRKFNVPELAGEALDSGVRALKDEPTFLAGSTDVSNVSRSVPTGQVFTCCVPVGVPGHSWQTAVSAGSGIGIKGMLYASRALADAALRMFTESGTLKDIKDCFEAQRQ